MRKVTINDHTFSIRPLTKREVLEFKNSGFPVYRSGIDYISLTQNPARADELLDQIFALQLDAAELEEVKNFSLEDERELFLAIAAETWGSRSEEKN